VLLSAQAAPRDGCGEGRVRAEAASRLSVWTSSTSGCFAMAFRFNQGDRPLDGYTIQRGVGRGGFGEVYYAVSDGGKEVALKFLRENPSVELRGVAACLNLKGPHLLSVYDVRQNADADWFIVMEYIAGPSLRDLMNATPGGLGPQ